MRGRCLALLDAARYQKLSVNPNAAVDETFFLEAGAFDLVKLWASAVGVERALASIQSLPLAPESARLLRAFAGYRALVDVASGNVLTRRERDNAAIVFTAPDESGALNEAAPRRVACSPRRAMQ